MVYEPGGAVAGAQLAHQSQRRHPGLVLADQVDGQEPGAQRQLRAIHDRASRQRSLVAARLTLKQATRAVAYDVVRRALTGRATESGCPAQRPERPSALLLAAVSAEEFRQRHPGLELDAVHRHGWLPRIDRSQSTGRQAHRVSQAEVHDELGIVKFV